MANGIQPEALGRAIEQELTVYHDKVVAEIDKAARKSARRLVEMTQASAPVGKRGKFKNSIASKQLEKTNRGSTYVWYVKPPDHRLTHLLVKGHATRNGGRTRANPFLTDAVDKVLPEFEQTVEDILKNGK